MLSVTHRDSMRRGQRTFRPDNKEDRHICIIKKITFTFHCGIVGLSLQGLNNESARHSVEMFTFP